jgi:hypothetical protein
MRNLFCIALILVCTSCATTLRSYPGDKRPTSEIAVLTAQNAFNAFDSFRNIVITSVDGKITKMKPIDSLELLPGKHLISVECDLYFKVFTHNHYSDDLKINVMAGHSYIVEFQNKQFCLKDITLNTTVTCGDSAKGGVRIDPPVITIY